MLRARGAFASVAAALVACGAALAAGDGAAAIRFADVTREAGIEFRHVNGAFGRKYLPETMGAGLAVLDFDDDGWPDLFFVNSRYWPGRSGSPAHPALYRNERDGSFRDVTAAAGLALELYGMGAAAADYDDDGRTDLYVTALGGNRLYRNRGDGRFEDVTRQAGVAGRGFGTSALFFDYDKDGRLDLFVANYVTWSLEKDLFCTLDGKTKSYCTPESYAGESPSLFRNRGGGRFEDVTRQAGLFDPSSKALGVAMLDFDGDAWIDLAVANDTQPNKLYRNTGEGRFEDVGELAGIAYGATGVARAGMGIDAGDYDGSGRPSLAIGNFSHESVGLYRNEGGGLFVDEAARAGVGQASFLTLAFATLFFDYDLDGWLDLLVVNGHVADDIGVVLPAVAHAQRPHLFRNQGGGRFLDLAAALRLARPIVGRGAAHLDYDNDGDPDLALTTNAGPAYLYRNDGRHGGFLKVKTLGTRSNRQGIGAEVSVTLPSGRRLSRLVRSGSSYCSQSELTLGFGLGQEAGVRAIEVRWPSGQVDRVGPVAAGRIAAIREGAGLVSTRPLPAPGEAYAP